MSSENFDVIDWKDVRNKILQQNPFTTEQVNSEELRAFDMSSEYTIPRKYRRMFKRKR